MIGVRSFSARLMAGSLLSPVCSVKDSPNSLPGAPLGSAISGGGPQPSNVSETGFQAPGVFKPQLGGMNLSAMHRENGESNFASGRFEEAVVDFTRAIETSDPANTSELYFQRGSTFGELRRYDEAIVDFSTAIELGLSDEVLILAYHNRAECRFKTRQNGEDWLGALNDFAMAIKMFQSGVSHPHEDALILLGCEILVSGNDNAAALGLEKLNEELASLEGLDARNNFKVEALVLRAIVHHKFKNYGNAWDDINRAIELCPGYPRAHEQRGMMYFFRRDYENVVKDLDIAITNDPDGRVVSAFDRDVFIMCDLLNVLGRPEEAMSKFEILEKNQLSRSVVRLKAEILASLGRNQEALDCYDTAVDMFLREERPAEGFDLYSWLLEYEMFNDRGKIKQRLGMQAEADEDFRIAKANLPVMANVTEVKLS